MVSNNTAFTLCLIEYSIIVQCTSIYCG